MGPVGSRGRCRGRRRGRTSLRRLSCNRSDGSPDQQGIAARVRQRHDQVPQEDAGTKRKSALAKLPLKNRIEDEVLHEENRHLQQQKQTQSSAGQNAAPAFGGVTKHTGNESGYPDQQRGEGPQQRKYEHFQRHEHSPLRLLCTRTITSEHDTEASAYTTLTFFGDGEQMGTCRNCC